MRDAREAIADKDVLVLIRVIFHEVLQMRFKGNEPTVIGDQMRFANAAAPTTPTAIGVERNSHELGLAGDTIVKEHVLGIRIALSGQVVGP